MRRRWPGAARSDYGEPVCAAPDAALPLLRIETRFRMSIPPRRIGAALALLAAAALAVFTIATASADTYVVRQGDTLSEIAAELGIAYDDLLSANPGLAPNSIQPGQQLRLPSAATSGSSRYEVRSGDNLTVIAERFGTTIDRLLELNPAIDRDDLQIGQTLTVSGAVARPASTSTVSSSAPAASSAPVQVFRYTVQPGDTATGIAVEFDTSLSAIGARNPGLNLDVLSVGQAILVPRPAQGVTVRIGDTLFGIGLRYGIDLNSMIELNRHLDVDALQPGDTVYIPHSASAPAFTAPAPVATPPATASPRTHVVVQGENLSGIAERYGLDLAQLRAANPQVSGDLINPGDSLSLPSASASSSSSAVVSAAVPPRVYVVQAGDNLGAIAAENGISLDALRAMNPQLSGDFIDVGDRIVVDAGTAAVSPDVPVIVPVHVVASGDTLYSIGARYGLTVDQLRALNPWLRNDVLTIGSDVRLSLSANGGPAETATYAVTGGIARRRAPSSDLVQYVAAELGTLPKTLLDNNPWLQPDQWIPEGTELQVPDRPGKLIVVEAGDTLFGLAQEHGVVADDLRHENGARVAGSVIVPGQRLIVPIPMPVFGWPVDAGEISDGFGICRTWDCSWRHRGLDVADDHGMPVYAAADGVVTFTGGNPGTGLGYYVEIQHEHDFRTVLAHLSNWNVEIGQMVRRGQVVGSLGSTGNSTGPHLHFEIRHGDWYVDPAILLPPR